MPKIVSIIAAAILINVLLGIAFRVYYLHVVGSELHAISNRMSLTPLRDGGISAKNDESAVEAARDRLTSLSANRGEAARYNRALHVIVLQAPYGLNTDKVTLNMRDVAEAGYLFIFKGPVTWTVKNVPAGTRAKLAFLSQDAFDLQGAPDGLLAGYEIGDEIKPEDYVSMTGGQPNYQFCARMAHWSQFFGAKFEETQLWLYNIAPEFTLGARVAPAGSNPQWSHAIAMECNPAVTSPNPALRRYSR